MGKNYIKQKKKLNQIAIPSYTSNDGPIAITEFKGFRELEKRYKNTAQEQKTDRS
jgi:hypothetical protein